GRASPPGRGGARTESLALPASDTDRNQPIVEGAVAHLTALIESPAVLGPIGRQAAGHAAAGFDLVEMQTTRHRHGRQSSHGRSGAELAVQVLAPAMDRPVGEESARM